MNYFVGSLKNPGHPFSTFIVGEMVSEEETYFMVSNVIKVIENPNPNQHPNQPMQIGMMFLNDEFFTTDTPAKIEKEVFLISKVLDPDKDHKMIRHLDNHYSRVRLAKSGLVGASPTPVPSFNLVKE